MMPKGIGVRMLIALLVAALAGSAAAKQGTWFEQEAEREQDKNTVECENAWSDAPAYDYCLQARVKARKFTTIEAGKFVHRWRCSVRGSCSITVDVGEDSTTFTPTVSVTTTRAKTDDIDICFSSSTTAPSGYTAAVSTDCSSTETDSDDATSDGLTNPTAGSNVAAPTGGTEPTGSAPAAARSE